VFKLKSIIIMIYFLYQNLQLKCKERHWKWESWGYQEESASAVVLQTQPLEGCYMITPKPLKSVNY